MRQLFRWSLWSFVIVAILGTLMRYKIGFSMPWLEQKFAHHAHSHFAFGGWVSQSLWLFILNTIYEKLSPEKQVRMKLGISVNLALCYGMLVGFLVQGYGTVSIVILCFYLLWNLVLVIGFWKVIKSNGAIGSKDWFLCSMSFQLLSMVGTIMLIYTMVQKNAAASQYLYLASVYWYLHFTYNGWFFFACMGLFSYQIEKIWNIPQVPRRVLIVFALSCIPAYGLSILWLKLPLLGYVFVVLAALTQTIGYFWLVRHIHFNNVISQLGKQTLGAWFLRFVAVALGVKFCLQLFSVIPTLSQMAFGFRPVVIAYLHLMLLSIISVFLLAFAWWGGWFNSSKITKVSLYSVLVLILVNQLLLAYQGITSLTYTVLPGINIVLLIVSIMLSGVLGFLANNGINWNKRTN